MKEEDEEEDRDEYGEEDNTDRDKLKQLANDAIEDYFEGIEFVIDNIVSKMADEHKIEDEDDIDYLKAKVRLSILKWE